MKAKDRADIDQRAQSSICWLMPAEMRIPIIGLILKNQEACRYTEKELVENRKVL